ncbi:alcohol dehydrogenase catalytic domain-containing protein [Desulfosarcina cetonica]|uniref:alcohol dehydrogenase catalytic domain-containing protein n=1 Tax=Desulfosarcina cetonica TaxID=90730 RepID=UPI000AC3377E|nr:alcohol dehydrogenase catalytic domain-containing protein [Desulfosarcina cetonica]
MPKAIRIHQTGDPTVMRWEPFDPGEPAPGEVRLRQEAVGLNFIDIYHRTGLYPLPTLPAIPGLEGAGVVESVGEGVTEFKAGDRVAYAGVPPGAYAQVRCIPAHRLVSLPEGISTLKAAGMMLRGMTARYLLYGCYPVKKGDRILVHAAAGGVGSLLCQWGRHLAPK